MKIIYDYLKMDEDLCEDGVPRRTLRVRIIPETEKDKKTFDVWKGDSYFYIEKYENDEGLVLLCYFEDCDGDCGCVE